jgi:hypothetical protein
MGQEAERSAYWDGFPGKASLFPGASGRFRKAVPWWDADFPPRRAARYSDMHALHLRVARQHPDLVGYRRWAIVPEGSPLYPLRTF